MSCAHGYVPTEGHEAIFSVDPAAITFGKGALAEAGEQLASHGCKRVALITDSNVGKLEQVHAAKKSLEAAGIDFAVYAETHVEPTDHSFMAATQFAKEGKFDGYLSIGGGSVIDTCKAASLYATYPAELLAYVNKPIGEGRAVPGALPPHVACPTTCGTGSECTGIAVFDYLHLKAKTGIASRRLRPTHALIDPTFTKTLPAMVVAASGFDVLCHALESFTARKYVERLKPESVALRPMSQGRNPWSDTGAREALRLAGQFIERGVKDKNDDEAREGLAWAATLAGIAFGNAGVHIPHAMSYSVAGLVRDYKCPGYPDHEPMVPHGISVMVNGPSAFRLTATSSPERHREAAEMLGAQKGSADGDVSELLFGTLTRLMKATGVPNGIGGVGYGEADLADLTKGAIVQKRLLDNAPVPVDDKTLHSLFKGALSYW